MINNLFQLLYITFLSKKQVENTYYEIFFEDIMFFINLQDFWNWFKK